MGDFRKFCALMHRALGIYAASILLRVASLYRGIRWTCKGMRVDGLSGWSKVNKKDHIRAVDQSNPPYKTEKP